MSLELELARLTAAVADSVGANSTAVREIIRERDQALKDLKSADQWRKYWSDHYDRECQSSRKLQRTITGLRGVLGREKARRLRAEGKGKS